MFWKISFGDDKSTNNDYYTFKKLIIMQSYRLTDELQQPQFKYNRITERIQRDIIKFDRFL